MKPGTLVYHLDQLLLLLLPPVAGFSFLSTDSNDLIIPMLFFFLHLNNFYQF